MLPTDMAEIYETWHRINTLTKQTSSAFKLNAERELRNLAVQAAEAPNNVMPQWMAKAVLTSLNFLPIVHRDTRNAFIRELSSAMMGITNNGGWSEEASEWSRDAWVLRILYELVLAYQNSMTDSAHFEMICMVLARLREGLNLNLKMAKNGKDSIPVFGYKRESLHKPDMTPQEHMRWRSDLVDMVDQAIGVLCTNEKYRNMEPTYLYTSNDLYRRLNIKPRVKDEIVIIRTSSEERAAVKASRKLALSLFSLASGILRTNDNEHSIDRLVLTHSVLKENVSLLDKDDIGVNARLVRLARFLSTVVTFRAAVQSTSKRAS